MGGHFIHSRKSGQSCLIQGGVDCFRMVLGIYIQNKGLIYALSTSIQVWIPMGRVCNDSMIFLPFFAFSVDTFHIQPPQCSNWKTQRWNFGSTEDLPV